MKRTTPRPVDTSEQGARDAKNSAPRRSGAMGRRAFGRLVVAGGTATTAACGDDTQRRLSVIAPGILLPPPGATVRTTACAYCIVGCGYKAYTWPVEDPNGGPTAATNALGGNYPVAPLSGQWISPQMHNVVNVEGKLHHIVVVPDWETEVVNVHGNYNLGGSLARRLYSPLAPTDRLVRPQIRVDGKLRHIGWNDALTLVAGVSRSVLDTSGPLAWGMKTYSYQFYENTYAITKLAYSAIGTPCWAPHDSPSNASSTPGFSDAGVDPFSAAYVDWASADVLFVSGVALYEAHSVLFANWVQGGPKLIVVNPRRDEAAIYAVEKGGIHLQIQPGTDTLLHNAIAWVILTEGWQDGDFISQSCADDTSLAATAAGNWRRLAYGMSSQGYTKFILDEPLHVPENAAPIVGVKAEDIRRVAELMAKRTSAGARPATSMMLEKGNMWTQNYTATASFVSLGLLVGAGNRAGRMISRAGGHQRGMLSAASYPTSMSPDQVHGNKVPLNLDYWAMAGKLNFIWVIGCTWAGGGTAAAATLYEKLRQQTRSDTLPQLRATDVFPGGDDAPIDLEAALAGLKAKIAAHGLVLVQQDIYPQPLTELADLVLPAAGWGESPGNRMQGERRLRHYSQIADPPGEAKPDWWIIKEVATLMGFPGFDWKDANSVFEEAGNVSKGGVQDYFGLVALAREKGRPASEVLAEMGTTGIQCPISRNGEALQGTVRLHASGFSTPTKKALFVRGSWADASPQRDFLAPRPGQVWVINRRAAGSWNSAVEDARNPFRAALLPHNQIEISPKDAARFAICEGMEVIVECDNVLDPSVSTGTSSVGRFRAVARVTDIVPDGVCCTYFNFRGDPATAANSAVPNVADPINRLYGFKLGRGSISPA